MDMEESANTTTMKGRSLWDNVGNGSLVFTQWIFVTVLSFAVSTSGWAESANQLALLFPQDKKPAVSSPSRPYQTPASKSFPFRAAKLPSAKVENQVFQSELDAVKHAMNTYNPPSIREDREYIGAIYQLNNGDGFFYSVAPGVIGQDKVSAGIPRLKSAKIVAFWHTHGAHHWNRKYFSEVDSKLVKQWDRPFYLGTAEGHLRILTPSHKVMSLRQAQSAGLGRRVGFAVGELIPDVKIRIQ